MNRIQQKESIKIYYLKNINELTFILMISLKELAGLKIGLFNYTLGWGSICRTGC